MQILPGVLAYDEDDFRQRLTHPGLRATTDMFHIDVLDGSLFGKTCWAEPNIVGQWKNLPAIELHCMVQDPLAVAKSWHEYVHTLQRVIVHAEISQPIMPIITHLRAMRLEVGIAVCPNTPIDDLVRLPIDVLMLMGVEPGLSGQAFLGEPILAKIRRAKVLSPQLVLAVDGGVNLITISPITKAGATRVVASSDLWRAENPAEAYTALKHKSY